MIYNIRTVMGITQEELCFGLCSVSALSKYENGERVPDSLLFYAFMQRLGKSADRVSIMISSQDAGYYEWKKRVSDAIQEQNWGEVKKLREEEEKAGIVINEILQRQYRSYLDAVTSLKSEKNIEKFYKCIKEAIEFTIPFPDKWNGEGSLISADELNYFLLYLYGKRKLGMGDSDEIKKILEQLEEYIEKKVDDVFEKSKIYPRLVCIKILLLGEEIGIEECIWNEKKALKILKKASEIYDMPEILRLLIRDLRKIGDEEAGIYEKQREALVSIMEEYGVPTAFRLENWYSGNERICLMNEYLVTGRKQKGITQEELSEGVCAVETYSRIESGKRVANKKNYLKLADRLDMSWGYYRGQIVTDDYRDFLLMTEQRGAIFSRNLEEAKVLLKKLENQLDMDEGENYQYVELMNSIIKSLGGKLSEEQQLEEYDRILHITIPCVEKTERFFSKTEMEIIFQIALVYRRRKEANKAIRLINIVLENNNRKSFVPWSEIVLLKRLRAGLYADIGEYGKCINEAEEVIRGEMKNQDAEILPETANLLGWGMELQGREKTAYSKWYVKAVYLGDLLEDELCSKKYREYYKNHINSEMQWY